MAAKRIEPGSPEFLTAVRRAIEYLPASGELRWLHDGSRAGVYDSGELKLIKVAGWRCWPQSLAWLLMTDEWVSVREGSETIGFRNGIDTDLRWLNLFRLRNDVAVTVVRAGDLFVLMNGGEQVLVDEDLERVLVVAKDILQPGTKGMGAASVHGIVTNEDPLPVAGTRDL